MCTLHQDAGRTLSKDISKHASYKIGFGEVGCVGYENMVQSPLVEHRKARDLSEHIRVREENQVFRFHQGAIVHALTPRKILY